VTVAVLDEAVRVEDRLDPRDVDVTAYRATGPGGQHRNKTETAIRVVHRPTGIVARSESERSQHQNRLYALAALAARVAQAKRSALAQAREHERRAQVGSGMRGDKVRTLRFQDDVVTCERTGRKTRLKDYLRGDLDWLHEARSRVAGGRRRPEG
jgi:peptide chain release factor 1